MTISQLPVDEQRKAVVAEARSWKDTPYEPCGRVKGPAGGCDCLTSVWGIFENVGLVAVRQLPHYAHLWHLHQTEELYLNGKDDMPGMTYFCSEVPGPDERPPLPGDVIMWRFGHTFSHAGIVDNWPLVWQAYVGRPFALENADMDFHLTTTFEFRKWRGQPRPRKIFVPNFWLPPC